MAPAGFRFRRHPLSVTPTTIASAGPAAGLIPRGRPSLVQPRTRRTSLAGGPNGRAVVTRSPHSRDEHAAGPPTPGPEAVGHLERLVHAVEGLLDRSGGRPSPLDLRLVREDVAVARDLDSRNRAWTDGVLAAIGRRQRHSTSPSPTWRKPRSRDERSHALLDCLRYEVDLDQLRDAWPQVRTDLRCYVLGIVREDAPEDLEVLAGVLRACGIRPLHQPEPEVAAAGLRTLLRALLATTETDRARFELRAALAGVHARGATPQLGRYLLARDARRARAAAWRTKSHGVPMPKQPHSSTNRDPSRRPTLSHSDRRSRADPPRHAGRARGAGHRPTVPWRGRSAYNVLRVVSPETRWPEGLRAVMEAVLDGTVLPDEELRRLVRGAIDAVRGDDGCGGVPHAAATEPKPPRPYSLRARSEVSSPADSRRRGLRGRRPCRAHPRGWRRNRNLGSPVPCGPRRGFVAGTRRQASAGVAAPRGSGDRLPHARHP